jgi:hypothetical protein
MRIFRISSRDLLLGSGLYRHAHGVDGQRSAFTLEGLNSGSKPPLLKLILI